MYMLVLMELCIFIGHVACFVLPAMNTELDILKMQVFWDMMLCCWSSSSWHFKGSLCFSFSSSDKGTVILWNTRNYWPSINILEGSVVQQHCCERTSHFATLEFMKYNFEKSILCKHIDSYGYVSVTWQSWQGSPVFAICYSLFCDLTWFL
jgi:hypothetical protein